MKTSYSRWLKPVREQRGLFNGTRVQQARELRGIQRSVLARKLGITAKELKHREENWCFWEEKEQWLLAGILDFPPAFFAQDDPPALPSPLFVCGHDEEGNHWCECREEL